MLSDLKVLIANDDGTFKLVAGVNRRDIFWSNFRLFRSQMRGKRFAEVVSAKWRIRRGQFGIVTDAVIAQLAMQASSNASR